MSFLSSRSFKTKKQFSTWNNAAYVCLSDSAVMFHQRQVASAEKVAGRLSLSVKAEGRCGLACFSPRGSRLHLSAGVLPVLRLLQWARRVWRRACALSGYAYEVVDKRTSKRSTWTRREAEAHFLSFHPLSWEIQLSPRTVVEKTRGNEFVPFNWETKHT